MNVNYRVAELADLDLLLELVREFHQHEQIPFDASIDRDVLGEFLTDRSLGQTWLIQQQEGEIIGYIILTLGYSLEYRGRDAFIDELYLRAPYRGLGIGTQTLAFARSACQDLGVRAIHLEVDFNNPDALRFYRRAGYQTHNRFLMTQTLGDSI